MSLDWITRPLDPADPCGADLFHDDDPEYAEYYLDALARLPEGDDYVKIGMRMGSGTDKLPDIVFNPKDVTLKRELASIDGLLRRSRDLRLLALRAQWSALAANPKELLVSLEATAALLEAAPAACHPSLADGPSERLDALNDIAAMGSMLLPLRYLELGTSGVSLRAVRVARGELTPHDGEDDLMESALLAALAKDKDGAGEVHGVVVGIKAAVTRIESACLVADPPHPPKLGLLHAELDAVLGLLATAIPDLMPVPEQETDAGDDMPVTPSAPSAVGPVVSEVVDHEDARRRLVAVETYFTTREPSSIAVLLVTQARQLIGQSMMEVFKTLLPVSSPRAKIRFVDEMGFTLSHEALARLAVEVEVAEPPEPPSPFHPGPQTPSSHSADETPEETAEETADKSPVEDAEGVPMDGAVAEASTSDGPAAEETEPGAVSAAEDTDTAPDAIPTEGTDHRPIVSEKPVERPWVTSQTEAVEQMRIVETYFNAVERSSPVPILLARARSYVGKDFESILREIVPSGDY